MPVAIQPGLCWNWSETQKIGFLVTWLLVCLLYASVKKTRPAASPGMFKPLTGVEADERMKEKYGALDKQTEIKSEKLSTTLFSHKRKSPLTESQKEKNSQGKERRKGT